MSSCVIMGQFGILFSSIPGLVCTKKVNPGSTRVKVARVKLRLLLVESNPSSKDLNILYISVSSKFATFDTYLTALKIIIYLCKSN